MTDNPTLASVNQRLAVGELVTLFVLDLTPIGVAGTYRFTNSVTDAGAAIVFGGASYAAVDFESEGWEYNGKGAFPRPKLRVSNVGGFLSGLVYEHNDLVGCKITRIRTYAEFLDGMPAADPAVMFPPDIYTVFQKTKQNKVVIEFELAAACDLEGLKLPARKILRDTCTHSYRVWTGSAWDYSAATCPYAGTSCWDANDAAATPATDECGRQLRSCKLRFPTGDLPTRAFPGVVRTRY